MQAAVILKSILEELNHAPRNIKKWILEQIEVNRDEETRVSHSA